MENKINVVYKIEKGVSWRKNSINIKSNIADDELVDCSISKSLIDIIVKESSILEPDKLLLKFAEAQKRELELNLEALNDMELKAKIQSDKITKAIQDSYSNSEDQYEKLQEKFEETTNRFKKHISESTKALDNDIESVEKISKRLEGVDNYGLERLSSTLSKIVELVKQDSNLVKLVLDYEEDKG